MHRILETAFVLVMGAALLSGCSLPSEQLSLPGPIPPPEANVTPLASKKGGTPLSAAGTQSSDHNRTYQGSGDFAAEERIRTGALEPAGLNPTPLGADKKSATKLTDLLPGQQMVTGSTEPASQVTKDGITINLANAPVAEVAKTVLGDILGLNYTVSDKITSTITLRTTRPVDKAGIYEIFETVLRAQDLAVVSDGPIYKVVPVAEAAAGGAPLRPARSTELRPGLSTEIIPLRYVAAPEMERIIKSSAPQAAILRTDPERNVLLISGTATELRQVNELIDVFDVDYMRGMSFGIFPVDTSDVEAIAKELDVIFANDRESPTKGMVRFVANRRLKSVLVITSRPEYLKKAETWISRIDKTARATEKGVFVYHVQNRPAQEVAQLLQKVYRASTAGAQADSLSPISTSSTGLGLGSTDPLSSGGSGGMGIGSVGSSSSGGTGGGIGNGGGFGPAGGVGAPQGAVSMPAVGGPPTQSQSAQAQGQQPGAIGGDVAVPGQPGLQQQASNAAIGGGLAQDDRATGISVVADEPNNSLVITATPDEYRRVRNILETIDIVGNQVLIEATIAEVTLTDELKFGVRWFFDKGASTLTLSDSSSGALSNVFPGFSYLIQAANIRTIIHALSSITDVNVVSQPTLTVVENKKAFLQVGDEVPIITQTAQSITTPDAPIVNSVTYKNTGVILGITPRVSDSGKVVLEIEQEVGDVVATTTSGIDSPTIQQRRIKTTVNVQDGQTIVLAGLIQDRASRERGQVPILGDIPYVGNAFKNKTDTIKRTELVIAITPQVIKDRAQIDDVTAEYRDKLNFNTRPQRRAGPDRRETFDRLQR